jgi:hypothetical protein
MARTKDLINWERLPDLKTPSPQQRNVVLHPEFVDGKYAFYTRPQDGFISTGTGGGIGFGLAESMTNPVVATETIVHERQYHTVYEVKNGQGPAPIKTPQGWLHLAHGVRNTAAGLRYVLYMFMTDLQDLTKIIHQPAGYFLAPEGEERVGDVSNVAFSNGWILDDDGTVLMYYASSDTRLHVATSSVERLVDYCINTPEDGFRSATSVETLKELHKVSVSRRLIGRCVSTLYRNKISQCFSHWRRIHVSSVLEASTMLLSSSRSEMEQALKDSVTRRLISRCVMIMYRTRVSVAVSHWRGLLYSSLKASALKSSDSLASVLEARISMKKRVVNRCVLMMYRSWLSLGFSRCDSSSITACLSLDSRCDGSSHQCSPIMATNPTFSSGCEASRTFSI